MTSVDVTVMVTVHNETLVCGPTMESAEQAIVAARAAGHTVQSVLALDNATDATTEYFDRPEFDPWEKWVVREGDPGRVRNTLVPRTEGRYVAFLDADDLFSENWLAAGVTALKEADERGERMIAHPELNVIFDGGAQMNQNISQDSPLFTPYFLYVRNCYDTLCLTPREAHLEVPYGGRDIANGISREDWQFAIETMGRGWKHVIVPDTIIFKRRRDFSMMVESNARKSILRSLPEQGIDRVRSLGMSARTVSGDQYP
jgi:Glycosyl transferase family 2